MLEVKQEGSRYVRTGRWVVPRRIDLRTRLCHVTLDFAEAVITPGTLRIDLDMVHGKLVIVSAPGIEIDADGLKLTYSRCKLRPARAAPTPASASSSRERCCTRRSSSGGRGAAPPSPDRVARP